MKMTKELIFFMAVVIGLLSCAKECEQDFFNFRLIPKYSIDSECLELGESLQISLIYPDTLVSFFDTVTYDLRDYNIVTSVAVKELSDTLALFRDQPVAFDKVSLTATTGSETSSSFDPGEFISFLPQRGDGSILNLSLTPNKVGTYYVTLVHGNAGVFEDPLIADGCDDLILTNYRNESRVNESLLNAFDSTLVTQDELTELIETRALLFFKVVATASECQ
jgi:hypothetical protein